MSTEVWYRKWRPQSFAEVTGQEHVTRTLANAVGQGRVAHAYLLCGPRGTGKTTTARVLAKAVNCERPAAGEPCNACESCRAVNEGRALDLIEMDAASNRGIDDIRDLRDRVGYHPSGGRYRVYLIDEVHELTAQAFDALLKTLEEPPQHIIFVLATTDAHRVPATIVSRCQRFDLTRIRPADVVARLRFIAESEGISAEQGALDVIARAATGSLRDGVNLLEQLVASYGTALTEAQAREGLGMIADDRARELAVYAIQGALTEGLAVIAAVHDDGVDMRQFNREVVAQLRALLLVKAGAEAGVEGLAADVLAEVRRLADGLDARRIVRALKAFSAADFRGEAQPSLPVELALAEVALVAEPEPAPERATATPAQRPAQPPVAPARPVASAPFAASERPAAPPPPTLRERLAITAEEQSVPESVHAAPETGADAPPAAIASGLAAVNGGAAGFTAAATLEEARARYRDIYNTCRTMHAPTGGLINGGDIVAFDGDTVVFGLALAWMAEKLLPGTQAHRVLASAVEQVLGRRMDVQCTHQPGVTNRLRVNPARPSHLLDEARRLGFTPVSSGP